MQGPLREDFTKISARSFHKDLFKITQRPLRQDFTRICTRSSHKDLCKTTRTSWRISAGSSQELLIRICARPCRQGPFRGFQRISAGSAQDLVVRTCTRQDVTRISTRPLRGFHQDHFVRACAVELHMDMSQEPFYVRIYRKNAGDQDRDA